MLRFLFPLMALCYCGNAYADTSGDDIKLYLDGQRELAKMLNPILSSTRKVARVYYVDTCSPKDAMRFPAITMRRSKVERLDSATLSKIFPAGTNVIVDDKDNIVRIFVGDVPMTLLKTNIASLKFTPEERYNAAFAVDKIEYANEVKIAANKLNFHPFPELTDMITQAPMRGVPHTKKELKNITMDSGLDHVVKTFGGTVFFGICPSSGYFSVDYIWAGLH